MNTSMQDAFNLGWKIASVIRGSARSKILDTYEQERLPIATALLEFDREIYQAITKEDESHRNLAHALRKENSSASGLSIVYNSNLLIDSLKPLEEASEGHEDHHPGPTSHPTITNRMQVGSRLPNMEIMYHCDARVRRIHSVLAGQGCWNLAIFGGNISDEMQMARLHTLATDLTQSPSVSKWAIQRQTSHPRFGSIDILLIHSASRHDIDIHCMPEVFLPRHETTGFDYSKVFADNESFSGVGGTVYQELGIPVTGCMILVRPDHHIAYQGQLNETAELDRFISRFLLFA